MGQVLDEKEAVSRLREAARRLLDVTDGHRAPPVAIFCARDEVWKCLAETESLIRGPAA